MCDRKLGKWALGSVRSSASSGTHSGEVWSCVQWQVIQPQVVLVSHSLGPSPRSREGLRAVVPHLGKGRGKGPHELRSTRSISSSPSWFSALSPVSQGLRALPGTLVGEMPPQLALLPPDSVELHGTCLPAAGSHILH